MDPPKKIEHYSGADIRMLLGSAPLAKFVDTFSKKM